MVRKILTIFIALLIGVNLYGYSDNTTESAKGVTVPVQPPAKRVERALGFYTIFQVHHHRIYFDAGMNENISKGDRVKIYRQLIIRNPLNGKVYRKKMIIGEGKVTHVDIDFSIAKVKWYKTKIRIGDLVKVVEFRKQEKDLFERHEIRMSLEYTDFSNLRNYTWGSIGFYYARSGIRLRYGFFMDYVQVRPRNSFDKIALVKYVFQFRSFSITPILGIAGSDVTWGAKGDLYLGRIYSTHLHFYASYIKNVGTCTGIDGTFRLSKNFLISSDTNISNYPDNSKEKRISSQLKITGIFEPVIFTIGGGFGGRSTDQLGPVVSLTIGFLTGGE